MTDLLRSAPFLLRTPARVTERLATRQEAAVSQMKLTHFALGEINEGIAAQKRINTTIKQPGKPPIIKLNATISGDGTSNTRQVTQC